MDEDTLAKLWETTLGGDDWESADPQATYRPVSSSSSPSVADTSQPLPTFSVAQGAESEEVGTRLDVSAPTLVGSDLPVGDEGSVPTLITPAPGSEGEPTSDTTPALPPSPTLYELREVIGKGGMGVVYRAHQTSLGRDVAIKTIKAEREGERWRRKFVGEAHATGRLAHPNIVPVYDLGQTPEGDALLAMKLVDGTTWKRLLHPRTAPEHANAERMTREDHLRILDSVCNAVAFAHSRGLAHCDLKPENVLIGEFGEVLVMDWGLALDIRDAEAPPEGPVPHKADLKTPCGTPSYMAPELARGEGERIGAWTDVYLLGAILNELLVGGPPHRGATVREIVTNAMLGTPPRIPEDAPAELREICLKAMAAEPAERYQSARELQDALQDYLRHKESRTIEDAARAKLEACQAKLAGDPSPEERDRLHRGFADALAGFAQALVLWPENPDAARGEFEARLAYAEASLVEGDLGLARSLLGELKADTPPRQAQRRILEQRVQQAFEARDRAERSARFLRRGLIGATVVIVGGLAVGTGLISAERDRAERNAQRAVQAARDAEEARAGAEAERKKASARLATALVAQGDMLGAGQRWTEARGSYREARQVLRSLHRSTLAAEMGLLVAEAYSPSPWLELSVPGGALAVGFSSDARRLVSLGGDGRVVVWDTHLGTKQRTLREAGEPAAALAVSPRDVVAVASKDRVLLWDLSELAGAPRVLQHAQPVVELGFRRDGARLLAGDAAGGLTSWDVSRGEQLKAFEAGGKPITGLSYRGDIYAFACDEAGQLMWWNAEPASVHWRYRDTIPSPTTLAFRPVAAQLAIGSQDASIHVWEWHEKRNNFHPARRLQGHTAPVVALAYSPDGARLVSASLDRSLKVWDAVSGALQASVSTPAALVGVAVSGDGSRVAAAGQDGRVRIWDLGLATLLPTGAERSVLPLPFVAPPLVEEAKPVDHVAGAVSPDGELAATADASGLITVWDARVGRVLKQESWHAAPVVLLRFLGAGERLLSVDAKGTCRVWDLAGMFPLASLDDGHETVAADVSADGRRLILGGRFGVARVYAIEDAAFKALAELEVPLDALHAVALDVDGRRALLGGTPAEGKVPRLSLWDVELGQQVVAFGEAARSAALSASGRVALIGGPRGELSVWDLPSGSRRFAARAHTHAVHSVVLVRDAEFGVTASSDGSWRVWSLEDGQEVRAFPGSNRLSDVAVSSELERVLTVTPTAVELVDLRRAAYDDPDDPRSPSLEGRGVDAQALAFFGAAYAWRGDARAATDLLERARDAGLDEPDRLWQAHWELGHHRAALLALRRTTKDGPGYAHALREAELERLEALEGSLLGREPSLVHSVAISPDGRYALTSSDGPSLTLWELDSGRRLRSLRGHTKGVLSVAFSGDGQRIASGDRGGNVRMWDLQGTTLWSSKPHKSNVNAVAFTPDDEGLLSGGYDKVILLHAVADGAERARFTTDGSVRAFGVRSDGAEFAVGVGRGEVAIHALPGGEELRRFKADRSDVRGVAYTPHGLLVACWLDKTLELWDPDAGKELRSLTGHWDGVYGMAVSPDGARAATVGGRGAVLLWDLARSETIASWDDRRTLFGVAIGPKGQRVLTGARDGTLRVRTPGE